MTERIYELGVQAMSIVLNGDDPDGDIELMYIPTEFTKTLAELIIKECAGVIHKRIGPKSALDILEHFGVEE